MSILKQHYLIILLLDESQNKLSNLLEFLDIRDTVSTNYSLLFPNHQSLSSTYRDLF